MSTSSQPVPVPPSWLVRVIMRPVTKALNPLNAPFAGKRHFGPIARLSHTGRRTGKTYTTSVGAHIAGEVAIIPLTFGNTSDWVRNVLAAGGCLVRIGGTDYRLTQPEFRSAEQARPLVRAAFSPAFRGAFRMLGIRQFLLLKIADPALAGQP